MAARKVKNENREKVIKNMSDNLSMLRAKLGLTQEQLANLTGLSRHTIMQIENKKTKMSWNTFLALLLIFIKNPETDKLLNILEIYTDELNKEIKLINTNSCVGSENNA